VLDLIFCNGDPMRSIVVSSAGDGYGFLVDEEGHLRQAGFGPDIASHMERLSARVPANVYPLAYPAYDEEPVRAPALRVTHSDGGTTTRLRVEDVHIAGPATEILLVDPDRPLEVRLCFRAEDHGVLRQWATVTNRQPGAVTLFEVAAASPLLSTVSPYLTHFGGGDWAAEWTTTTEPLTPGTKLVESRGGVQPHLRSCPFFLLAPDGAPHETRGTVLAGALAWGGNTRFAFERTTAPTVRAWCGHNPAAAEYVLDPGATFTTPDQIWAWSVDGVGPLSRRLHRWVRTHAVRDGDELRPIVVNNWEATFFSFDTGRLLGLIDRAADLGAELFLLDDGWFGTSHPRNDDTAGLGDWQVNEAKLPGGLGPLIERARERGILFGLWVEPEMVSPRSVLYAEHPDWVVGQPTRPRREWRQQLVLDVLQPTVAGFVLDVVDRTLAENPGISYLKWDANRPLTDPGSPALPADRQANYWVDHVRATWDLMATVVERHPEQTLMLCASGGGRVDLGSLRWFHEVWLSDNTDPLDRVRMQWAASHFLPANAVAAHVTAEGERPLAFGCAVALSARFGFDLDLQGLGDEELAVCRRAVALARDVRPLVQQGDLWRLLPPDERAALSYVSPDGRRAVVFGFQLADGTVDADPVQLGGLHPDRTYEVVSIDLAEPDAEDRRERWSGAALMERGLAWPLTAACTARVWVLRSTQRTRRVGQPGSGPSTGAGKRG
jgi:alpha-galactosidase